eukprot:CAMPEP_0185168126 /NCGR_PEP_ID=MMETSP1139-20130426/15383_1 /TAXON_ID=298111 /ORGANISM="Pavlova sp., Strain CCMP459" /LENGTH=53 /DNA_ID=CAMNT_0027733627 /DNA_START=238 /DNA_END=399 /DNA_ORIENTATION=+
MSNLDTTLSTAAKPWPAEAASPERSMTAASSSSVIVLPPEPSLPLPSAALAGS